MSDTYHLHHDWLGLNGRVCVVTGAASGMGRATALALARSGARLALLDLNGDGLAEVVHEIGDDGGTAVAIACDTSDPAAVDAAAEQSVRELGPCEGLVNNAGILRPGALAHLPLDDWNKTLAVNLNGYLLCAQAFGRQMLDAGRGAMVHVSSIAGRNPQTRSGAYSAAKAGVIALGRQIAAEWGPKGIRSNIVSPGLIRTAMSEAFYQTPGVEEKRAAVVPVGRVGTPDDIAQAALFLLSDRAAYINGVDILVDGGYDCMLMDLVPRPGFEASDTDGNA